jgi:hypothetical protein
MNLLLSLIQEFLLQQDIATGFNKPLDISVKSNQHRLVQRSFNESHDQCIVYVTLNQNECRKRNSLIMNNLIALLDFT